MSDVETPTSWVGVTEASATTSIPPRTIYAWIEAKRLPSKERDRKTVVNLTALQNLAAARNAACAQPQAGSTAAALPEVERARARVELVRAATEEALANRSLLDAEDALRRAQQEADQRHLLLATTVRTNDLDLRERESKLEVERLAATATARAARERADVERQQRQRREERERRRNDWIADWCARVAEGVREAFGPASMPAAVAAVRTALGALDPEAPDSVVRSLIITELHSSLADVIAAKEERVRQEARERMVDEIVLFATLHYRTSAIETATRAAAADAAREVDPYSSDAFARISRAAVAARDAAYQTELERTSAEETTLRWGQIFDGLEDRVMRWWPTGATREERTAALAAVRALFEQRPGWMTPAQFERESDRALAEHKSRISIRIDWEDEDRRIWDAARAGLGRTATVEDRRSAETELHRLLTEMRASGRTREDFRIAARRLLDERRVALSRAG